MDTADPDIEFNANGVCNHCREYEKRVSRRIFRGEDGERKLQKIARQIKEHGENRE